MTVLFSEDEAAKQNQKILSIFAAPPVPPAEGRKGKDFLVLYASEASGRGAEIGAYDSVLLHHALRA